MTDFVYVATADGIPGCKIGYSNNPKGRMYPIGRDVGAVCQLRAAVSCGPAGGRFVERDVHQMLANSRIEREWFDVSVPIARSVIRRTASLAARKHQRWRREERARKQFYAAERKVLSADGQFIHARISPDVHEAWKAIAGNRDPETMLAALMIRMVENPALLARLNLPDDDETYRLVAAEHTVPDLWSDMEHARRTITRDNIEYRPVRHLIERNTK